MTRVRCIRVNHVFSFRQAGEMDSAFTLSAKFKLRAVTFLLRPKLIGYRNRRIRADLQVIHFHPTLLKAKDYVRVEVYINIFEDSKEGRLHELRVTRS